MIIALLAWLASLLWEMAEDELAEEEETEETAEEETPDESEEDIKNPRVKELSAEAKKWRLKFRAAEKRIGELQEGASTDDREVLRASRLETAFLREVLASEGSLDVETAWDLLNARGFADTVKVNDDGAVEGMAEAMSRLVDRYPWLSDELPEDEEPDRPDTPRPGVGTARRRKDTSAAATSADLKQRMSALRKKRV